MRTAIIIPARIGSTRFPRKVLADIKGKPLIQHVYQRALLAKGVNEVIVATDSTEVMGAVESFGGRATMTLASHASGTDRIAEAASGLDCDIIVNVQGDEPLIEPATIETALGLVRDQGAPMGTCAVRITHDQMVTDPNTVKIALASDGYALYFSRAPIPYHRDLWDGPGSAKAAGAEVYKHIGIYSYSMDTLTRLSTLSPTALEQTEKLEQLRALDNGIRIKVGIVQSDTPGVDTQEDLERVKAMIK